jgi:hypothetical protein
MPKYEIDVGNSTHGPVGLVIRLRADDPAQALAIAQEALWDAIGECQEVELPVPAEYADVIDYMNVYVSPDNLKVKDVAEDTEGEQAGAAEEHEDLPRPDLAVHVPTGGGRGEAGAGDAADLYMQMRPRPAEQGVRRPTLVVTYEALLGVLQAETAVLVADDAPGLCKAIARRALAAAASDREAVEEWVRKADADIAALEGDEESGPEPSRHMLAFFEAEVANHETVDRLHPCTLADAQASLFQMPEDELASLIYRRLARAGAVTVVDIDSGQEEAVDEELFRERFDNKDFETELQALLDHYGEAYPVIELIPEQEEDHDA